MFLKARFIGLIIMLLICFLTNAQLTVPGKPFSYIIPQLKSAQLTSTYELKPLNTQELLLADSIEGIKNRYSIGIQQEIAITDEANLIQENDEGRIWTVNIHCKGAQSLALHFKQFFIPDGAMLFIFNSSKTQYRGAFSNLNNKDFSSFSIADFPGDNVTIEYFEPQNSTFSGQLKLGSVSAAYKELDIAFGSVNDVVCPKWHDWRIESHSVARVTYMSGTNGYVCTGTLINTVRNDGTPYFLTANHCINMPDEASSAITYFNFEADTCGQNADKPTQTLSGSILRATSSLSDFALLELSEMPPPAYTPYFAGWDASGANPDISTCIHHPRGRQKVAITTSIPPEECARSLIWDDKTTSPRYSHFQATFINNNILPGSSGSALFNENHLIIGQLHGDDNNYNYFGKLSKSWNTGSNAASRLDAWLDPDKTGELVHGGNDKYLVPKPEFKTNIEKACVNSTVTFYDQSVHSPTNWVWRITPNKIKYVESTDSFSQNPQIQFLDTGAFSVTLKAINSNGTDSITKNAYIQVNTKINVALSGLENGNTICRSAFSKKQLIAAGALNYQFKLYPENKFDSVSSANILYVSLNNDSSNNSPFAAQLIVTGNHGQCSASDTISFNVYQQPNDNLYGAIKLNLGLNGPFSNICASPQRNEPQPAVSGCNYSDSWCYDTIGHSAIQNSIWFTFQGPSNGHATFDVKGFDCQLAIYKSAVTVFDNNVDIKNLILVNASDNRTETDVTPLLSNITLTPGETYYIQIDGFEGATGEATITILSNTIEVSSNPTSGKFSVIISSAIKEKGTFEIYSPLGQLIKKSQMSIDQVNKKFEIDITGKTSGIYTLIARLGSTVLTRKILLLHKPD